ISDGRLLLNIVTGGLPKELAGDGLLLDHDERYVQTDEFLTIWRGLFAGGIDFAGRHLVARDARLGQFDSVQKPHPPLWFGGSSPAGMEVAARHVSTYLTWAEPPTLVAEKLAAVRARAAALGRTLRYGMRVHLIVRETTMKPGMRRSGRSADCRMRPSSPRNSDCARNPIPSANCVRCNSTAAGGTGWRSAPICGPGSVWCGMASARRWSVVRTPSPHACANIRRSGSRRSSRPATRISRKPIASPSCCSRCSA